MFGRFFKKTDYKTLLDNGAIIVDVRSPQEYAGGQFQGQKTFHRVACLQGLKIQN